MSNRTGKDLLGFLEDSGMLDYNVFIRAEVVREQLDLVYPEVASLREFRQLELQEMSAVDYVRNVLLNRGMYLRGVSGGYRILTVSENFEQVDLYMDSADRKLRRAQRLLKSTPREASKHPDQYEARMQIKRDSIRSHRDRRQPPEARA